MTRSEYRTHLKDIILMVFSAEQAVHEQQPDLTDKLRTKSIDPDDYLGFIADEIMSRTPDSLINQQSDEPLFCAQSPCD